METKKREKYLLIGAASCLGILLLNWLVFTPVYNFWNGRQEDIAKMRKQIEVGKMTIRRADTLDKRWEHMQMYTLPTNSTVAELKLANAFAGWANDSRVVLVGTRPAQRDADNADDNYKNQEMRVDVQGNVQQVRNFLYAVESNPLGLKVDEVEINARDDYGSQFAVGLTVSGLILLDNSTNATQ